VIEFVAFRAAHLPALKLQAWQASFQPEMTEEFGREMLAQENSRAYTALFNGRPIACAGAFELWPGRAYLWSFMSDEALVHMREIHRYARKMVSKLPWQRVEAYCDARHAAGARWLLHLGFEFECVARKWSIDGRDMSQFARVS